LVFSDLHFSIYLILINVWKEVLGVEEISIKDDFFNDLGGHSLLAAKAASILRYKYKIELAIRDLYVNPTIEKISVIAESKKQESSNADKISDTNTISKSKFSGLVKTMQAFSMCGELEETLKAMKNINPTLHLENLLNMDISI